MRIIPPVVRDITRVVAASTLLLACVAEGSRSSPAADTAPAPLLASEDIPGDFLLQQQIRFRWNEREGQIDAAVQNACGELTVILLTPYGAAGTVIRQRGRRVDVSGRYAGELPFDPERLLLDVQRTNFVPFSSPAPPDGTREWRFHGQRIAETWNGGRLVERVFDSAGETGDRVRIRYPDGATAQQPPAAASLDSELFGYHLDVTTLSRVAVSCSG
jgi:hypothetical protein